MKKLVLPVLLIVASIIGIIFYFPQLENMEKTTPPTDSVNITREENLNNDQIEVPFQASFRIITNGIERNFSASMYKNQSDLAYIPNDDSSLVIVTKNEVTWRDFFETLPFTLNKECLITGDGAELCNGNDGLLTFELNGEVAADALDTNIKAGDQLIVRYQ